jgi:hypothetical protein
LVTDARRIGWLVWDSFARARNENDAGEQCPNDPYAGHARVFVIAVQHGEPGKEASILKMKGAADAPYHGIRQQRTS